MNNTEVLAALTKAHAALTDPALMAEEAGRRALDVIGALLDVVGAARADAVMVKVEENATQHDLRERFAERYEQAGATNVVTAVEDLHPPLCRFCDRPSKAHPHDHCMVASFSAGAPVDWLDLALQTLADDTDGVTCIRRQHRAALRTYIAQLRALSESQGRLLVQREAKIDELQTERGDKVSGYGGAAVELERMAAAERSDKEMAAPDLRDRARETAAAYESAARSLRRKAPVTPSTLYPSDYPAVVAGLEERVALLQRRERKRLYDDEEICESNNDADPCGDCYGCLTSIERGHLNATDVPSDGEEAG